MFNHNQGTNNKTYFIVLGIALALLFGVFFAIVYSKAEDYENKMNYDKEVISEYEKRQEESNELYSIWRKYHQEYDSSYTTESATEEAVATLTETTTEEETVVTTLKDNTHMKAKALAIANKEYAPPIAEITTKNQAEYEEDTNNDEFDEVETETELEENTEYVYNHDYVYDDEIDLLCRIVNAENGSAPDWVIQYTAQVILNRVVSSEFPNNVHDVVSQVDYIDGEPVVQYETYWNGAANAPASQRVIDNVINVLENGTDLPSNILGQSMGMWSGCHSYCQYNSPDGPEYFFWWED